MPQGGNTKIRNRGRRPRVAAKRRDSIAQGAAQRNPGLSNFGKPGSPERARFLDAAMDGNFARRGGAGNHALSGLRCCIGTSTQGCTLGYRITHLRCYGSLIAENT